MPEPDVPCFVDLPELGDTGERSGWGVFGDDDDLGTTNFITADAVRAAAATVELGEVHSLSLPLDQPAPALAGERDAYRHEISRDRAGGDDHLDGFFPQGSTQWDGLGHVRFREFGYYGGAQDDDLDAGRLGIDALGRHGLTGRGVLLDVPAWTSAVQGHELDPTARTTVGPDDLDAILDWQGTELAAGDVLVLHTGWLEWYVARSEQERADLAGSLHNGEGGLECPGLDPAAPTAAWLWDHRVAAMAADNPTVEALRVRREDGFLHRRTLALLGMPIGEFWWLRDLAARCRAIGRHHFLLSAAPWVLPRGVGSPVNPVAVL